MKLPYLEKIGQRGDIAVWSVDGIYVRRNLDEEFTNFGQHYRFECIPENEFWIDRESILDEQQFYIDHLLMEYHLMKKGVPYVKALEFADRKERSERKKVDRISSDQLKGEVSPTIVHLQVLAKTYDVTIWLVNGRLVRDWFDIDFTEGGHDLVYKFVPKGEVWIDNDVEPEERSYILLHELHERNLMKKGLSYNEAHADSSRLEYHVRHHPKELSKALEIEIKKK
jgi:hypothetical protein